MGNNYLYICGKHIKYRAGVVELTVYLGTHKTGDRYQTDIRQTKKQKHRGLYRVAPQLKICFLIENFKVEFTYIFRAHFSELNTFLTLKYVTIFYRI